MESRMERIGATLLPSSGPKRAKTPSFLPTSIKPANVSAFNSASSLSSSNSSEITETIDDDKSRPNSGSPTMPGFQRVARDVSQVAGIKRKSQKQSHIKKIDDQMNYDHLLRLEQIFTEGSKGGGGLDMEQFRVAMKKTMGSNIDDGELNNIFRKVDTNCDGTLDWGEYLTYMLLEYQEKKNMVNMDQDCPFPTPMITKTINHLETICNVRLLQAYTTRFNIHGVYEPDDVASKYVTVTRDGLLHVWNLDWSLQKTCLLDGAKGINKTENYYGLTVTDMICMPNCNTVAVASTEFEISFYVLISNMIQKRFQIKDLSHCALCMDYKYDIQNPSKATMVWGDASGSIVVIRFSSNPNLSLFSAALCINNKMSVKRLLNGSLRGLNATIFRKIHTDWVVQVSYCINKKGQECLISCCSKSGTALFFGDITEKQESKISKPNINSKSTFYIRKGILCHAYDPEWNLIVTGSRDSNIKIWNPYIVKNFLAVLKGHKSAVTQLFIRQYDHNLISISKDKNVRVWDLRDYSCKQNIHRRRVELGRNEISAACFSSRYKELVLATNKIGIFQPRNPRESRYKQQKLIKSHHGAVTSVLYNPLFNQIVTGGEDSTVCVWDLETGEKKMLFSIGEGEGVACMSFDPTYRRLLTGGRLGSVVIWNFNNGAKLQCYEKMDDQEIVDVLFIKKRIIAGSWNRHLIMYFDSEGQEEYEKIGSKHNDDILSIDYHQKDKLIASSTYNGDILLKSINTGNVVLNFNMHVSLLPIHPESHKFQKQVKLSTATKNQERKSGSARMKESVSTATQPGRRTVTPPDEFKCILDHWLPEYMPWLTLTKPKTSLSEDSVTKSSNITATKSLTNTKRTSTSINLVDRAIYKVLFLQTRQCTDNMGSLMTAGTDGWICTWSVHQTGGMLAYFNACKRQNIGTIVTHMVTDSKNTILFTGDSRGYIRKWDIEDYCCEKPLHKSESLDGSSTEAHLFRPISRYLPATESPPIKLSLRAHLCAITAVSYIEKLKMLATGGLDCSVRLWTERGRYIGTFGQTDKWKLEFPIKVYKLPALVPDDLKRSASLATLYTAKGCTKTQWQKVKNVHFALTALKQGLLTKKSQGVPKILTSAPKTDVQEQTASIQAQLNMIRKELLDESSVSSSPYEGYNRQSVTIWIEDLPHSIASYSGKSPEVVDKTFERIQKEGITSNVLGRLNYRPKQRHRQPVINPEIKWCSKHAVVFQALPYTEMEVPTLPEMPHHMLSVGAGFSAVVAVTQKRSHAPEHHNYHTGKRQSSKADTKCIK